MCNPAVIPALKVAATVIGIGATLYSASAAQKAGKFNRQVAEVNAQNAEAKAVDATRRGQALADERRMKTRLMIGQQRAAIAANGVDLSFGTPVEILGDTAMFGAIDEDRIMANAAREAWGYRTEAANMRAGGQMAQYQGDAQATGSYLGAAAQGFSFGADYASGAYGGGGSKSYSMGALKPVPISWGNAGRPVKVPGSF
jgi:hypothetical protein